MTSTDRRRDWLAVLAREQQGGGHRLGVIVERGDEAGAGTAIDLLTAAGLSPHRRLARIGPRYGEVALRSDDIIDFGARYGHEYVTAMLRVDSFPDSKQRGLIESALRNEGCDVAWH